MTDKDAEKKHGGLCAFAPDKSESREEDAVLYRKTKNIEEWIESSERCIRHVNERLDQIEEEINTAPTRKK